MNASYFPIPAYGTEDYRLWRKRLALQAQEKAAAAEVERQRHERGAIESRIAEIAPSQAEVMRVFQKHPATIIIAEVADEYKVLVSDIMGDGRQPHVTIPRHHCFYRLFTESGLSYKEIGRRLNRDHSTVFHGIRVHAARNRLGVPITPKVRHVSKDEKPKPICNTDRIHGILKQHLSTPLMARDLESLLGFEASDRPEKIHALIRCLRRRGVKVVSTKRGYLLEDCP